MRRRARSCYVGGHWWLGGLRRRTKDCGARPQFEEAEEAWKGQDEAFEAVEDIHMVHRYFGQSLKDALPILLVCMSSVATSICLLCYISGYVQIA